MEKTFDVVDVAAAREISLELEEIARKLVQTSADGCNSAAKQIRDLLLDGVAERGLFDPVTDLLGAVTGRLLERGLDRAAVGQVLFSTWHGRRHIVELDALNDPQVADQTKRIILWALMELFNLVKDTNETPTVAWLLMQTVIDVFEVSGISSKA